MAAATEPPDPELVWEIRNSRKNYRTMVMSILMAMNSRFNYNQLSANAASVGCVYHNMTEQEQ
jgi:hypothetical protein